MSGAPPNPAVPRLARPPAAQAPAPRQPEKNGGSIIDEVWPAIGLGCKPSLQAVGHAALGAAVEPRRNGNPHVERMTQPVARRGRLGDEREIFATRNRGNAAERAIDIAAHCKACAGMVGVTRPGVVRIRVNETRQTIDQRGVLEMARGAPVETRAKQRFFMLVADQVAADQIGAGADDTEARFNQSRAGAASASVENRTQSGPPQLRARSIASRRAVPT